MPAPHQQRVTAPSDQRHHHHRGELHNPKRFFARFGNSLDVFPPKVNRRRNGERCRGRIGVQHNSQMCVREKLIQQPRQILSC
jgi:hypothetical protein